MVHATNSLSRNIPDEYWPQQQWLNMAFHEAERLWNVVEFSYRDELHLLDLRHQGYSVRQVVDLWFGR